MFQIELGGFFCLIVMLAELLSKFLFLGWFRLQGQQWTHKAEDFGLQCWTKCWLYPHVFCKPWNVLNEWISLISSTCNLFHRFKVYRIEFQSTMLGKRCSIFIIWTHGFYLFMLWPCSFPSMLVDGQTFFLKDWLRLKKKNFNRNPLIIRLLYSCSFETP